MNDLRERAIAAYKQKSKAQYEQHLKNLESQCWLLEREFVNCFSVEPDEVDCKEMTIKSSGLRFKKSSSGNWGIVDTCVTCGRRVLTEITNLAGLGEWFEGTGRMSVCNDCQRMKIHEAVQPKSFWKRILGY